MTYLNYEALDNKALFTSIVAKPISLVDGVKPNHEVFKNYLQSVSLVNIVGKNYQPPSKTGLAKFEKLIDQILKLLDTKEFKNHYDNLHQELMLSGSTTRRLKEEREKAPKTRKITSEQKIRICNWLYRWWLSHTNKKITGTYDNKGPHLGEYYDKQNIKTNPGAFFIQSVFGEYFNDRMNNKQIKDLITETNKVYRPKAVILDL